jgi:putative radical SAM enzyme (TIGR03279 family)
MRETLYFKDDDARLSFLQGNYITLTNLTEPDVQRIIDMKLSVNVSVHTTNPELRVKMMNNRFAGEALEYLKRMAAAKIHLNCQIVLCKGWNDGRELLNSLLDLNDMKPAVKSVAVVPVGLTKYRENLTQFQPFTPEDAKAVIDITRKFNGVFAADEFYLLAGEEIPPDEYYGDYPQYENGVGMVRYQIRNFEDNIDYIGEEEGLLDLKGIKSFSMAVGTSVAGVMGTFAEKLTEKTNVKVNIFPIKNLFWGESITVSGLITAGDIINQLKDKDLGDFLLLPKTMLNSDNLFLDNLTVEDIEKELNVKVRVQEFLLQE